VGDSRPFRSLYDALMAQGDQEEVSAYEQVSLTREDGAVCAAAHFPHAMLSSGVSAADFEGTDYQCLWRAMLEVLPTVPVGAAIPLGTLVEFAARQDPARFSGPLGEKRVSMIVGRSPMPLADVLSLTVPELRARDELRHWAAKSRALADKSTTETHPLTLKQTWLLEAQQMAVGHTSGPTGVPLDEAARDWKQRKIAGAIVPTGFAEIDKATGGGLGRGEMMVVGGGTSHGKSFLAAKLLKNQADRSKPTLYISTEDPLELMLCRMLADYADPPLHSKDVRLAMHGARGADPLAIDAAAAKMQAHQQGNVRMLHAPKWKVSQVCQAIRTARYVQKIDLVVVDYLQAIEPDEPSNNKTQDVSFAVSALKKCANEVGVALVVCSQYARDDYRDGQEPSLNACKYAGDIENESEIMLLLWRDADEALWGRLAKLKWASTGGHRYILSTNEKSGAILDWMQQIPNAPSDSGGDQKQQSKRPGGWKKPSPGGGQR